MCVVLRFLVLFWACLAMSCDKLGVDNYGAAVRSGKADVPLIRDFVAMFPRSVHEITHYSGQMGNPSWRAAVGVYGRYVISLEVPITLDSSRTRILSTGQPVFSINEVDAIQYDPSSGSESITPGRVNMNFGQVQWDELVKHGGDLSVLGIDVVKNRPVKGFDEYWHRGF